MRFKWLAAAIAAAALLAGCGRPNAEAPVEQPAPEVGIHVIQPQRVAFTTELPGRTSAFLVSEVRPQVGGIIQKREFVEGADVEAGQVLYQIDPATYQAALDSAHASLAKARADVTSLKSKAQRYKELLSTDAVARQDYDDAVASQKAAEADVAYYVAQVKSAGINLDYTRIVAPISGRIGKSNVTQGALVTASQDTALATIQDLDRIYVDVTQSSADYLRLKRDLAEGKISRSAADQAQVKLLLEDGSTYPLPGTLQFSDVTVDQTTGSITLRAIFPNPDQDLLPGMYVRAVLEEGVNDKAILAPQQGVTRSARGDATALVVGGDNKVEQRQLKADRTIGDQWLITSGLQAGDRLIIEGVQKVRVGMIVKPVEQPEQSANAAVSQPPQP
jgi:membrane fusion protein (multidrug efflux system)